MKLYLPTLSNQIKMRYISKLQGTDKVEKIFFTTFSNGNTLLSGNFFGVMESCHLMTRANLSINTIF